jgi:hypothetical protein
MPTAGLMNSWSTSWTSGAGPKSKTCWQLESPYPPCVESGSLPASASSMPSA